MTYSIKREPADFKVTERISRDLDGGDYLLLKVTKRRYNTEDMVQALARHTQYDRSQFGYAGNKDREAITTQHVSVQGGDEEAFTDLQLKDITVDVAGRTTNPLRLGDLDGNTFTINVYDVENNDVQRKSRFVNYFDTQRFSEYNHVVGKHLVTGSFDQAAKILLDDPYHGDILQDHLNDHPNDYTTALRELPENLLSLFVHAYQSQLWNRCVKRHRDKLTEDTFPIIGFSTDPRSQEEKTIIRTVLDEEKISKRSFIIRSIPELSMEGTRRQIYQDIEELTVQGDDPVTISFYLDKGSYATMAIKHLLGNVTVTT